MAYRYGGVILNMLENRAVDLIDFSIQLIRRRKISKAINLLHKVLEVQPKNLEAINLLANCLFITGHISQAAQTWKMALKIDKHNKNALNKLKHFSSPSFQHWLKRYHEAERLVLIEEYDTALERLHRLLQENDGFVRMYELLGLCYWAKSQESMALRLWKKGLELDKSNYLLIEYINKTLNAGSHMINKQDSFPRLRKR